MNQRPQVLPKAATLLAVLRHSENCDLNSANQSLAHPPRKHQVKAGHLQPVAGSLTGLKAISPEFAPRDHLGRVSPALPDSIPGIVGATTLPPSRMMRFSRTRFVTNAFSVSNTK